VKALEAQLENEHEEWTLLLREKHELKKWLAAAAEAERNDRAGDEALLQRLKRDLKRTKSGGSRDSRDCTGCCRRC
jgi:myosin-18